MAVTMKDIASLLGISRQAVATALEGNGHTRVSEATRAKVLRAARELNYIPNAAARSLRGGTTSTIGILISPGTPYTDSFFAELCKILHSRGYNYLSTGISNEGDDFVRTCQSLSSRGVDGIIIIGARKIPPGNLLPDLPLVFCRSSSGMSDIDTDKEAAGYLITSHLLSHGHSTVAYLDILNNPHQLRLQGWHRALKERHAQEYQFHLQDFQGNLASLSAALRTHRITALFCSNDFIAGQLLKRLSSEGWRIPEDLAIAGCDGNSFVEFTSPTLTTVIQPIRQVAEGCVQLMLERIKSKCHGIVLSGIRVAPVLWPGGSCGCPEHLPGQLYRLNCTGNLEKDYILNYGWNPWEMPSSATAVPIPAPQQEMSCSATY